MAKFFVGQRVRLVVSRNPKNIGVEGRISCIGAWKHGDILPCGSQYGSDASADLYVDWDRHVEAGISSYKSGPIQSFRVEPILPEGSAPSEFTFQQLMDSLREVMA